MKKCRQNRLLIFSLALILIYIFISASLHYHNDGKHHEDCSLCNCSNSLQSMQTECTFNLDDNFQVFIKINQDNFQILTYISIQDFVIRPPPFLV